MDIQVIYLIQVAPGADRVIVDEQNPADGFALRTAGQKDRGLGRLPAGGLSCLIWRLLSEFNEQNVPARLS